MNSGVSARGLESVGDVASRLGISVRCAKRRLHRLAAQISKAHPNEPPLLHRLGGESTQGARWYMDRAIAWRFARGFIGSDADDPWTAIGRKIDERFDVAMALLEQIAADARASASMVAETLDLAQKRSRAVESGRE